MTLATLSIKMRNIIKKEKKLCGILYLVFVIKLGGCMTENYKR